MGNLMFLSNVPEIFRPRDFWVHAGQARRDPESGIFNRFWIPAFTGMTEEMNPAKTSIFKEIKNLHSAPLFFINLESQYRLGF
jgi:hypothetical protein